MAARIADGMSRAWCHDNVTGDDSVDFLRADWFTLADLSVDEVRERFCLRPKSEAARRAGSAGPWSRADQPLPATGRAGCGRAREDRPYDSFGAEPA